MFFEHQQPKGLMEFILSVNTVLQLLGSWERQEGEEKMKEGRCWGKNPIEDRKQANRAQGAEKEWDQKEQ